MSRIGKKPITIPSGVEVNVAGCDITVKGSKGTLAWTAPSDTEVRVENDPKQVLVDRRDNSKQARANHGLVRSLVENMVVGVSKGYEKKLEIFGTGYNCDLKGRTLHLNIGYMGRNYGKGSQFEIEIPEGVDVEIEVKAARGDNDPARLAIRGIDKQKVGQFAAEIRALRKTEPYKGKGIRYVGEYVKRKQGKALTGGG